MNFFKFLLVITTFVTTGFLSIEASKRHHENQQHSEGGKKARTGENKDKKASKRHNEDQHEDQQRSEGRKKARTGENKDEKNERRKEVKDDSGKEVKDDSGLDEKKREQALVPSCVRAPQTSRLLSIPDDLFNLILSYIGDITSKRWLELSLVCQVFKNSLINGLIKAPLHIVLSNVSGEFFKKAKDNSRVQGLTLTTYSSEAMKQIAQCWKKLKMINLSETNIDGAGVVTLLAHHPNLEAINLDFCTHITDEGINELKTQHLNLKTITLRDANISCVGVATLLQICPQLEEINLNRCIRITSKGINELKTQHHNLKTIDLTDANISGVIIAKLLEICPQLEAIYLDGCRITDEDINDIKERHLNLKTINLSDARISGVGVAKLFEMCPQLEEINLNKCRKITDKGINKLKEQHLNLKTIDLSYTNISGVGVAKLLEICPQLKKINLNKCRKITDKGINKLKGQYPNLKMINLSNTDISGTGVAKLLEICPRLEAIDLSGYGITDDAKLLDIYQRLEAINLLEYGITNLPGYGITDEGINELKTQHHNLKTIDLSKTNISGVGVATLLEICPQLKKINLAGCRKITDEGIKGLEKQYPNLKIIDLSQTNISGVGVTTLLALCPLEAINLAMCANITDKGIDKLQAQLPDLKIINLSQTNISGVGVAKLLKICPNLEIFDLYGCKNVTDEEIEKLRSSYPNITILKQREFEK